jgi:hypothetical protein
MPKTFHRKNNAKPLLPQTNKLTAIHFLFEFLRSMESGMFGRAIHSEPRIAAWNPSNAAHAL